MLSIWDQLKSYLAKGDDDGFLRALRKGIDLQNCRVNGLPLLHLACKYGRFNAVQYLIAHRGVSC